MLKLAKTLLKTPHPPLTHQLSHLRCFNGKDKDGGYLDDTGIYPLFFQAVEIICCGAMPPDKENQWTTQVTQSHWVLVYKLITFIDLHMKIMSRIM